ncbi:MAG: poly-gamma-glutamate biosynthesis protein PgsC [Candidatus Cloacimonetes bacterium]|nr:poly-gamma-glutamate biosynthesis protein PgsC [Candidatus Cloacimonadota bacterium]
MIEAAVGLGVLISLIFTELLGASAGGIIVPGYIAMHLHDPKRIIGTLLVSLATLMMIKLISKFTLVYGKRRMVLSILIGFIFGWISNIAFQWFPFGDTPLRSIGFIIPGLIANWFERQGVIKTVCVMLLAAVMVRLIMIIIFPGRSF